MTCSKCKCRLNDPERSLYRIGTTHLCNTCMHAWLEMSTRMFARWITPTKRGTPARTHRGIA